MFLVNRRSMYYFDWISFGITIILSCIGLFFVKSATYAPEQPYSIFYKKQLFGFLFGAVIYFAGCLIDFRTLMRLGYFSYFVLIALLGFTMIKGSIGMGAQRWINLGFIKLQPSELCKLLFPAFISYYFYTEHEQHVRPLKSFLPVITMLIATVMFILKQPDLGTAILVLLSGTILLLHTGFKKKWFFYLLLVGFICTPVFWYCLKPYQKRRVQVFLGQGDARKERYQTEQANIAIGSGGLYGKGYLHGTQNIFQFLPESRTDFIFAVIAEEWGFIGALFIILLFLLLSWRLLSVIQTIIDPWIQLLSFGIIIHIILSVFINIGMVTGLLPIVGIPLPLLSYGLSNLWVVLASLGWFNGIAMRRFELQL